MPWKFNQKPSAFPSPAAYQSAYHKARREARIAAGLCVRYSCDRPAAAGRTKCREHLKRHAEACQRHVAGKARPPSIVDLLNDYDAVL